MNDNNKFETALRGAIGLFGSRRKATVLQEAHRVEVESAYKKGLQAGARIADAAAHQDKLKAIGTGSRTDIDKAEIESIIKLYTWRYNGATAIARDIRAAAGVGYFEDTYITVSKDLPDKIADAVERFQEVVVGPDLEREWNCGDGAAPELRIAINAERRQLIKQVMLGIQ